MTRPKLQLALDDYAAVDDVIRVLDTLHDLIDIIEVGTPLIIRHGIGSVQRIRALYPNITLLADLKIVDAGYLEAQIAFEAGADIVTVLGVAGDSTIRNAVTCASAYGGEVMADLIAAPDLAGRAQQLDELAVDAICVHSASDVQAEGGNPLAELATLCRLKTRAKVAVAGGVNPTMAAELLIFNPEIVVVGGYITGASGHRAAAQEIVDALAGGRNRLAT